MVVGVRGHVLCLAPAAKRFEADVASPSGGVSVGQAARIVAAIGDVEEVDDLDR